jgi:hypothetical protein
MNVDAKTEAKTKAEAVGVEELFDDKKLSTILHRSVPTIQKDRLRGTGVPFVKVGRLVRYRPSAVRAYLAENERQSTSEDSAK